MSACRLITVGKMRACELTTEPFRPQVLVALVSLLTRNSSNFLFSVGDVKQALGGSGGRS